MALNLFISNFSMVIKILKYLVVLFIVILLADRTLYYCIDKMAAETLSGESGGKINAYVNTAPTPTLLIMGPSNPAYQINPQYFSIPTYNLGHANTEDAFQTALLSIIIQKNKIPKNILLHVDPYDYLGTDSSAPYISNSPLDLEFYYGKNALVTNYINELGITERIKFLLYLTRYNNRIISVIKNYSSRKAIPYGYLSLPVSNMDSMVVTTQYKKAQQEFALHPDATQIIQGSKMRYLLTFVALCKQYNIHLMIFTLPKYKDVRNDDSVNDIATKNLIAFCNNNDLQYFDFRKKSLTSLINTPSDWKDLLHLNEFGSVIESKFVSKEINPYVVK